MFASLQPEHIVEAAGLVGILAIIFAESGLFFGFFLPGDSLLFSAGLFASQGHIDIWWLVIGSAVAAIVGDSVGYAFGKKVGPALFSREDSVIFHKRHAARAKAFSEKYGPKAIVMARFVPIVRTFAPIVAGVGGMAYRTFIVWNVLGGALWTLLLSLSGYFLGRAYPSIGGYIDWIVLAIIALSLIPVGIEWARAKRGV